MFVRFCSFLIVVVVVFQMFKCSNSGEGLTNPEPKDGDELSSSVGPIVGDVGVLRPVGSVMGTSSSGSEPLPQGVSLLRVRGVQQVQGVPQVRGKRTVPQVRGGGQLLGSARFASRKAWIGPPYTQVSPPLPHEIAASRSGTRKKESKTGKLLTLLLYFIFVFILLL